MNKTNPIGVRFRADLLEKLKKEHGIDSPQKALVFYERFYAQNWEITKEVDQALRIVPNKYDAAPLPSNFAVDYPAPSTNLKPIFSYNELRELICASTSSSELHKVWKEVEKNKELANWQIKILNQLKEDQRTKIDF